MYGFNVATGYTNSPSDEPFVTFSNLPEEVTIKIYSLSGTLLRTLDQNDKIITNLSILELGFTEREWNTGCLGTLSGYCFITKVW